MSAQQNALSRLANSMRLFGEANLKFEGLKKIDLEEAVHNLDRTFEAKLEAFHSLYDVDKVEFDYFAHADTAVLVMLRNAIHHRDHPLFSSWNEEMALNGGIDRSRGAEFIFAAHEVVGAGHTMRQFYRLDDFYLRLDETLASPHLEDRMGVRNREKLLGQINSELNFSEISRHTTAERYPSQQVYLNIIPIFISALCRVFGSLNERGVKFGGFDAGAYKSVFVDELSVDLNSVSYDKLRIL
ncbi:MAG: hypothetical protein AAFZ99_11605 [Pseudomonadota bacterium]